MKQEDLKSKTSEKLESELKSIKTITEVLIGLLSMLFAVTIYGLIALENKTAFIAPIGVAISCIAILPSQFSSMKKIKAELELRKNS